MRQANGSNIKNWWILHHYFSMVISITVLTWPHTSSYMYFRTRFLQYAVFQGVSARTCADS